MEKLVYIKLEEGLKVTRTKCEIVSVSPTCKYIFKTQAELSNTQVVNIESDTEIVTLMVRNKLATEGDGIVYLGMRLNGVTKESVAKKQFKEDVEVVQAALDLVADAGNQDAIVKAYNVEHNQARLMRAAAICLVVAHKSLSKETYEQQVLPILALCAFNVQHYNAAHVTYKSSRDVIADLLGYAASTRLPREVVAELVHQISLMFSKGLCTETPVLNVYAECRGALDDIE